MVYALCCEGRDAQGVADLDADLLQPVDPAQIEAEARFLADLNRQRGG